MDAMYIPKSFSETDLTTLQTFMQQHNFATLISRDLTATHLPLMLDTTRGEYGTLTGHVARANSHWKCFDDGEVLVMFQGAHTYISPRWYETTDVPTWNYAVVHVYGIPHLIQDPTRLTAMLEKLVDHHEAGFSPAWTLDLSADTLHKLLQAIVGFEIEITRLEGKFKLSQNRSDADQQRVSEALATSDYAPDREVGALMRRNG
jgi:transcriptional regulator